MQKPPWGAFCNTSTFIRLPFVVKVFVLSIFEWLFYNTKITLKSQFWSEDVKILPYMPHCYNVTKHFKS